MTKKEKQKMYAEQKEEYLWMLEEEEMAQWREKRMQKRRDEWLVDDYYA